jgi:hypothetical protein
MKSISLILLIGILLLSACSGEYTKYDVERYDSVELQKTSGKSQKGIVLRNESDEITMVLASKYKKSVVGYKDISGVRKLDVIYDEFGREISAAEVNREKSYTRTVLFGLGGLAIGGALGFLASQTSDEDASISSPEVLAGAGLFAGLGVYWGLGSDHQKAIAKVRYDRRKELPEELKNARKAEEEKLRKLKEEKKKLEQRLNKNK